MGSQEPPFRVARSTILGEMSLHVKLLGCALQLFVLGGSKAGSIMHHLLGPRSEPREVRQTYKQTHLPQPISLPPHPPQKKRERETNNDPVPQRTGQGRGTPSGRSPGLQQRPLQPRVTPSLLHLAASSSNPLAARRLQVSPGPRCGVCSGVCSAVRGAHARGPAPASAQRRGAPARDAACEAASGGPGTPECCGDDGGTGRERGRGADSGSRGRGECGPGAWRRPRPLGCSGRGGGRSCGPGRRAQSEGGQGWGPESVQAGTLSICWQLWQKGRQQGPGSELGDGEALGAGGAGAVPGLGKPCPRAA